MSEPSLFALENVSFAYPSGREVLRDVSFAFDPGRKIGLYGTNGSGKTTLFHVIMGLVAPSAGRVLFHGVPISGEKQFRALRREVGLVMQNAEDQLFNPTVLDDVAFGPLNLGLSAEEARERAEETLRELGLAGFGSRLTHRLSGGEKKLVSLATILSMRPGPADPGAHHRNPGRPAHGAHHHLPRLGLPGADHDAVHDHQGRPPPDRHSPPAAPPRARPSPGGRAAPSPRLGACGRNAKFLQLEA